MQEKEVSVKISSLDEYGKAHKTNESILVDAATFGEAEEKATKYLSEICYDFTLCHIKCTAYNEVIDDETCECDDFYRVKAYFITINESNGKERRIPHTALIRATSPEDAISRFNKAYEKGLSDYVVRGVAETKIHAFIRYGDKGVQNNNQG